MSETSQGNPDVLKEQSVELDLSTEAFTTVLAEAPIYAKKALITARIAEAGEVVETVTPDGTIEGSNTTEDGDVVITNTVGADFILKPDNFNSRYEATENPGEYKAKGMARIMDNPTGKPIKIMAPWGEYQYAAADGKIATVYDPEQPDVIGEDRYLLDKSDFDDTYSLAETI